MTPSTSPQHFPQHPPEVLPPSPFPPLMPSPSVSPQVLPLHLPFPQWLPPLSALPLPFPSAPSLSPHLPPPLLLWAPSPPCHRGIPLPLRCLSEVSRAAMARGPARACLLGQGPALAAITASPHAWLWQKAQASLRHRSLRHEVLKGNCPFNPSA